MEANRKPLHPVFSQAETTHSVWSLEQLLKSETILDRNEIVCLKMFNILFHVIQKYAVKKEYVTII